MGLISFTIEGTEYIDDLFDTSGGIELDFGLNSNGVVMETSISNAFGFNGDAYTYLHSIFCVAEDRTEKILEAQIQLECCSQAIDFSIEFRGVRFSEYCNEVYITLLSNTPDNKAYDCMNVVWFRSGFLDSVLMPKVLHCVEQVIEPLGLVQNCPFHYTPLVRQIYEYHCNRCSEELGIDFEFSSTIFQQSEYRTAGIFQSLVKGKELDDTSTPPDENNYYTWTIFQLSELIREAMNTRERIRDGKFIIERRDHFDNGRPTLFDLDEAIENGQIEEPQNIFTEGRNFENYAYLDAQSAEDSVDTFSRALRGQYNDIVEWNPNALESRRKEKLVRHTFAPPLFAGDVNSDYAPFNDNIANGNEDDVLMLPSWEIENPKMIIFREETLSGGYAWPVKRLVANTDGKYIFNMPMSFDENQQEAELYQNFWFIDAPDNDKRHFTINEVKYLPSDVCGTLTTLINNGTDIKMTTSKGEAYPENVKYIDEESAFVLSNFVVKTE